MRQKTVHLVCYLGVALFLSVSSVRAEPPIVITATTGMVADVAKAVAGEKGQVRSLIAPGIDPHLYKPTRSDIAALIKADIVFYNGLLLEGKMIEAFEKARAGGRTVVSVADGILQLADSKYSIKGDSLDPHLWMDPQLWSASAIVVEQALSAKYPQHGEYFRMQSQRYQEALAELNAYAIKVLETVPTESRVLVTAHDAFGHFGMRYGFEVVGIQGVSTESEAGVQDIERIVDLLVSSRVRSVFIESTVSQKNIQALIEGAAARGHLVKIGGSLFSDAMGPEGSYEGTYIGMIDHNLTAISRGLGGQAPMTGMHGKLSNAQ
jgi:manganese/zinc/iron transport system substrate-binding protein